MKAYEVNFDGLVGPTHNYAGLSFGNVASERHLKEVSNPKEAAKQGLKKMKTMADMGFKQGVIMPQQRPDLTVLRQLGFSGTDVQVIDKVAKCEPRLLAAVYSASSMWTANAATVSPSADTLDAKVHLTAANLNAKLHRSIEHETTSRILKGMFADCDYFTHHQALPPIAEFGDEGAANHTRFCHDYGKQGVELFVYGQQAFNPNAPKPLRYPARQTLEACQAIARLHGLDENYVVYAQQKPATIDAGVFHNDVISVGNRDVFFYHELAFDEPQKVIDQISSKLPENNLRGICVKASEVSLKDAVDSYLFNSQLLSLDNETMLLVVPEECREIRVVSDYLDNLVQSSHPIQSVKTFDLKQSMKNGGGPACLRLRVVLKENELAAVNQGVLMNDALFDSLNTWVDKHYRDRFSARDMADFTLIKEVQTALDELTGILGMPSIYPFQTL